MTRRILAVFFKNDRGQDIAEYCLITALIALVALGIFIHMAGGVGAIWNTANTTVAVNAASAATNGDGHAGH